MDQTVTVITGFNYVTVIGLDFPEFIRHFTYLWRTSPATVANYPMGQIQPPQPFFLQFHLLIKTHNGLSVCIVRHALPVRPHPKIFAAPTRRLDALDAGSSGAWVLGWRRFVSCVGWFRRSLFYGGWGDVGAIFESSTNAWL